MKQHKLGEHDDDYGDDTEHRKVKHIHDDEAVDRWAIIYDIQNGEDWDHPR